MTDQVEFDRQFEGRAMGQPSVLDFMEEEVALLKQAGEFLQLQVSDRQAILIWEHYSEAMDATWMSGSPERVGNVFSFLVAEPKSFWEYPLRCVDRREQ